MVDVVSVIEQYTRSEDKLCRYGGDEFVLLLPGSHVHQAYALATRLSRKIDALEFESSSGSRFKVSCSIGVATHTSDDSNVIERADKALYKSKKGNSGRYICTAQKHTESNKVVNVAINSSLILFTAKV
ncbi:response regulator/GGDEF domain protein [Vibrio maritimus]|uniref:diguanylate cyclase n=1 Tax=Vibrio maritimus TaxID=990268 RepID=A0A090T051_9VIBR|nr:response regulator/GGDEF domain protein [Vibrio maritimus]